MDKKMIQGPAGYQIYPGPDTRITVTEQERMSEERLVKRTRTLVQGFATYIDTTKPDEEPFTALKATFLDFGKAGVTKVFSNPETTDPSPELLAKNRANFDRAVTSVMRSIGAW